MTATHPRIPVSPFVGRAHEIADVKRLLATSRLVILTGTGGSGKTWLALAPSIKAPIGRMPFCFLRLA